MAMSLEGCTLRDLIATVSLVVMAPMAEGQTVNTGADAGSAVIGNFVRQPLPQGQSFIYGIDAGIGESDNVTLVSADKVSQTIAVTDVDFDLKQQSRLFDVNAKGDFSYLDYLQHAYSGELVGRFDGTADVALIPERLTWVLQDDFGQAQIDPFTPVTPNNQENVNYVSTGPDLALRFGPNWFLDSSARYSRTTYQSSPFDSNRLLGNAALGFALSAQSSVAINGSFERVMFEDTTVNTDFDRSSAYGRYEVAGSRTDLTANLGVTRVDQGSDSITGPLLKLQIARSLSSASQVTFAAGRDVTDASTGFANLQSGAIGTIGTAPAAVTLTNYTVTYGTVGWQYSRNRTAVGLSGTWEKDAYDALPQQNLTRATAQVRVDRKLNRAFTVQILGNVYRINYQDMDFSETGWMAGAVLIFRPGRALEIKLRADHASQGVAGIGSGYAENRAFLTIGYRPRQD
jgi:hypothetical protein